MTAEHELNLIKTALTEWKEDEEKAEKEARAESRFDDSYMYAFRGGAFEQVLNYINVLERI